MATHTHDVLISGHGLAGAVMAHHLTASGLKVLVFDAPQEGSASQVAAGVVNPISLRRDVLTWRAPEMLAAAHATYTHIERFLGATVWRPIELIKLFPTPAERLQWERAMAKPETAPFLSLEERPELQQAQIRSPHGHGVVHQCAWLDLRMMLQRHRALLLEQGLLQERLIDQEEITETSSGVHVEEASARWMIHCNGSFSSIPGLVPVKGEVLTVRIRGLKLRSIIHRGIFILPLEHDLFRVGATYQWNDVRSGPSQEAREHLLVKLGEIMPHQVEVLEHRAGVRPAAKDRRPILGRISEHQAIFNGLGSRGVMLAPWCAQHLAAHLLHAQPLDPEVDLKRTLRS